MEDGYWTSIMYLHRNDTQKLLINQILYSITLGLSITWPRVRDKHVVILKNNSLSVRAMMRSLWNTMHLFYFTKSKETLPSLMISDDWTYKNQKHASQQNFTSLRWDFKFPYIKYTTRNWLWQIAWLIFVAIIEFLATNTQIHFYVQLLGKDQLLSWWV